MNRKELSFLLIRVMQNTTKFDVFYKLVKCIESVKIPCFGEGVEHVMAMEPVELQKIANRHNTLLSFEAVEIDDNNSSFYRLMSDLLKNIKWDSSKWDEQNKSDERIVRKHLIENNLYTEYFKVQQVNLHSEMENILREFDNVDDNYFISDNYCQIKLK